ncbi:MAG TPA: hypothetical protein VHU80_12250 [Polyangiaceae bacterium]|nr:hypothetical protein [Polyangiaceae bacterium]
MKPGVVWHQFVGLFGCRPPRGCELPKEVATANERAAALAELLEEAKAKGYKRGWALHRFKQRFGYWPERRRVAA